MKPENCQRDPIVAGVVRAECTCCAEPRTLVNHVALGAARMLCATSGRTCLDRGDGVFAPDGARLASSADVPDVLSERPVRTQGKTRIQLERATFA